MAFTDVDEDNAALRVLPGSHKHTLPHLAVVGEENVLGQGVDPDVLEGWLGEDGEGAEILSLKAGEISIHDCRIAHGSPANTSQRLRCGLNMTFSQCDVTGDGKKPSMTFGGDWESYLAPRSVDRYGLNPIGRPPDIAQEDIPTSGGGSHSSAYH